ncbi:MAG: hypothetical protein WCI02_11270 [Planctomycetota bacterium]
MSRTARRGDDYAPAMFPFLAVLLCTIGALVLILAISVVHSHASAKREIAIEISDQIDKAKEKSDFMETVSEELIARREKVKQEIERRRKDLTNIEDHIDRLRKEMDGLRAKAAAIDRSAKEDEQAKERTEQQIVEVRSEIEKKKKELAEEIEKQKKKKPAFSIIPYEGSNGTSRRPVYIECRSDGVIIQPEGVLISIQDLRPPHGPGNPLDAALRVLRNAYQQRDATFGITTPPYPLLVVRPDGIHTYALARSAMSGWDDQFGYELVEADMDLAFPPGIPSIASELGKALDLAKRRQEVLIASSPSRFGNMNQDWESDEEPLSDQNGSVESIAKSHGNSWGDEGEPSGRRGQGEDSGRWKMVQELRPGQVNAAAPGHLSSNGSGPSAMRPTQPANGSRSESSDGDPSKTSGPGLGSMSLGSNGGGRLAGQYQTVAGQAPSRLQSMPQAIGSGVDNSAFSSGLGSQGDGEGNEESHWSSAGGNAPRRMSTGGRGSAESGSPGSGATGGSAATGGGLGDALGASSSGSGEPSTGSASGGNVPGGVGGRDASGGSSANAAGAANSRANAFSSGSATGSSSSAGSELSSLDSPDGQSAAMAEIAKNGNAGSAGASVARSTERSNPSTLDPAQGMPSGGRNAKSSKKDHDAKPISVSAGKGWAVSRGEGKATPVSRPIRIVVLEDRWLLRAEEKETKFDSEIRLDDGPTAASKQLEKSVRERVDSWGPSLPGGFWSPTITMESASDATLSVQRLQRLLEGSGVEVRVVPLQTPMRKAK